MLKKSSLRSFMWCYSFFYCFYCYRVIHSLNNFPLLVILCVWILSLPTERYKSKYISIMTIEIKKWTTSHESLWRARLHTINIFFLELFWASKNPKSPWMVSITVNFRNLKFGEKVLKTEWIDACPGNLDTFEAVFKISQNLFWSISSKYLTVMVLGSYLFFSFFFILSYELYFCIFGLKIACSVLKLCLKRKREINELFPDTTVFFNGKNACYEVMG